MSYAGGIIVLLMILSCSFWLRKRKSPHGTELSASEADNVLPEQKEPVTVHPSEVGKAKHEPLKKKPADIQPLEVSGARKEKPLKKEKPDDHSLGISLYVRR